MNINNPANIGVLQTEHATILAAVGTSLILHSVSVSGDILLQENTESTQTISGKKLRKVYTNWLLTGTVRLRVEIKSNAAGKTCQILVYSDTGVWMGEAGYDPTVYTWFEIEFAVTPQRTYLIEQNCTPGGTAYLKGTQICGVAAVAGGTLVDEVT
jgi:hypothetical protein